MDQPALSTTIVFGGGPPARQKQAVAAGKGWLAVRAGVVAISWKAEQQESGWGCLLLVLTAFLPFSGLLEAFRTKVWATTVIDPRSGALAYDPRRRRISLRLEDGRWVTFRLKRVGIEEIALLTCMGRLFGERVEQVELGQDPHLRVLYALAIIAGLIAVAFVIHILCR